MELRYYQQDAIDAVLNHIETKTTNPCVEIPTGGGKTPIIAVLCRTFVESGYRVLSIAHRKELLEQTVDKMKIWAPNVSVGVVSAGLGRREFDSQVVVAGIQSIYKKCNEISQAGKIDFLIVDEAHLIPERDEADGGMYKTLIGDLKKINPALTTIGLTATPYRLSCGNVCGAENILNEICYRVGVSELISGEYLSKLVSRVPPSDVDFEKIRIERREFKSSDVEEQFNSKEKVFRTVSNILRYTKTRNSVLVFCCSVLHAEAVAAELKKQSGVDDVAVVTGATDKEERKAILECFQKKTPTAKSLFDNEKSPPLKYLCNVDVLTTGFDATNIDCVVMLRPTLSPGLYYQMVGRGLRLHPGKENCLILDFGGNMKRFGPIDSLKAPKKNEKRDVEEEKVKSCPRCFNVLPPNALLCDNCGFQFDPPNDDFLCPSCGEPCGRAARYCARCGYEFPLEVKHDEDADFDDAILTDEREKVYNEYERQPRFREPLEKSEYLNHPKKGKPNSLECVYKTRGGTIVREFVCFGHSGLARKNAVKWWVKRSDVLPVPVSTAQALDVIQTVGIAAPTAIVYKPALVVSGKKTYPELCDVALGEKPDSTNAPRTDNPCGIRCKFCVDVPTEKQSFRYLRDATSYRIVCARCGGVRWEGPLDQFEYDRSFFEENNIRLIESKQELYDFTNF